ncbi:MAG: hypothetical protein WCH93_10510 [Actinomycetota bacterium]
MNRTLLAVNMAAPAGSARVYAAMHAGAWPAASSVAAYSKDHSKSSKRTARKAFRHST